MFHHLMPRERERERENVCINNKLLIILTVNQLSDPPVHVALSPVHVKSSWHHPHTPSVIIQRLHL